MSNKEPMIISHPLIIMFKQDDKIVCHIHPEKNMNYEQYGLAICDLVRHVAKAFKVNEKEVWKWVNMERNNPTTSIEQAN